MEGPACSTTEVIYMQFHEQTATSTALHPQKFGNDLLMFLSLLNVRT